MSRALGLAAGVILWGLALWEKMDPLFDPPLVPLQAVAFAAGIVLTLGFTGRLMRHATGALVPLLICVTAWTGLAALSTIALWWPRDPAAAHAMVSAMRVTEALGVLGASLALGGIPLLIPIGAWCVHRSPDPR